MPIQVNDNGIIRTLNKIQVNDNGIIRELSKVQANDNGVIREIFGSKPISVEYTGEADIVIKNDEQGYAILKTSGVFSFTGGLPRCDVYLVGNGENAVYDSSSTGVKRGGNGGKIQKHLSVILPASFDVDLTRGNYRDVYIKENALTLFSSENGVSAAAGEWNPVTDFWGRNWAGGGGNNTGNNVGGSNGAPGSGAGGGSSPIGGGGGGEIDGIGGVPFGANGYQNSFNGGGAGGGGIYEASQPAPGIATGGGGSGGASGSASGSRNGLGGGGGGLGGGGGGYTDTGNVKGSQDYSGYVSYGGGGAIVIRWGDSPL